MATSSGGILKAYNNCLTEMQRILGNLGHKVSQENARATKNSNQTVSIFLNQILYFENWSYRSQSKVQIDILADVKETVRLSDSKCTKSTVVVNYFLIDGDSRIACDAIKYDFDEQIQRQHPICHAQNENRILDNLPETFPVSINQQSLVKRHQAVRIPTAFINLAGLLEKLTADHLSNEKYTEFWESFDPYISAIPCHSQSEQTENITNSTDIRSRHWYSR